MDVPRPAARLRRARRWAAAAAGLLLALGVGAASLAAAARSAPRLDRRTLRLDRVREGELLRTVRGPGTLVPRDARRVAPAVDGRVERVLARPGAAVQAETVLVELSNPDLEQAAADARSALEAGRAELAALRVKLAGEALERRARVAEAKAAHETARLEVEADEKLFESGIIAAIPVKRAVLAADRTKARLEIEQERLAAVRASHPAQLAAQEARVEQLRLMDRRRREQVEALCVRAGMDGVLQALSAEPGQRAAAGAEIARVARAGQLRAVLAVPEIDARDLAVGQRAEIDTRNGVVEGTVERVDPAVRSGAVSVDVALEGDLPAGARADLAVDGVIVVERIARARHVARPMNGRPEGPAALYRVDADGRAMRVPVRLGKASVDRVVVLDGLAPGDTVIVSDVSEYAKHERLEVK